MRKKPVMEKEPATVAGMRADMKQDAREAKVLSRAKRPPPRAREKPVPPGMFGK